MDTTGIAVRIDGSAATNEARALERSLTSLGRAGTQVEGAFDKLSRSTGGIGGAFAKVKNAVFSIQGAFASLTAALAVNKFFEVNREFGKLEASLVTVTGSADKASSAFIAIQKLAADTPLGVSQLKKLQTLCWRAL